MRRPTIKGTIWITSVNAAAMMVCAWEIGFDEPLSLGWFLTGAAMIFNAGACELNLRLFARQLDAAEEDARCR